MIAIDIKRVEKAAYAILEYSRQLEKTERRLEDITYRIRQDNMQVADRRTMDRITDKLRGEIRDDRRKLELMGEALLRICNSYERAEQEIENSEGRPRSSTSPVLHHKNLTYLGDMIDDII